MRFVAVALAGIIALNVCQAQTSNPSPGDLLKPSPVSIALTVGRWLLEPSKPKIYYIRVQGHGQTMSQARAEGFKLAVSEAIGSLLLSETEVVDNSVRRREIIEYSSGYVDRFTTLNRYSDGRGGYVVEMDVWVKGSQIADRLLNTSKDTNQLDGERISEQVRSLQYERSQGDRVLNAVLNDYPRRAFDIKNQTIESRFGSNRRLEVTVNFELSMNRNYVISLYESMKATSQNPTAGVCWQNPNSCNHEYYVHMRGKNDGFFFSRWNNTFGFNDSGKARIIYNKMYAIQPAVMITIKNGGGQPIHRGCYYWAELDGQVRYQYPQNQFILIRDNYTIVDSEFVFNARAEITNLPSIADAKSVDLHVVPGSECPAK